MGNHAKAREAGKQGGLAKEYEGDVQSWMMRGAYIL